MLQGITKTALLGLPVPKALDRKGFLNIPKCQKTSCHYVMQFVEECRKKHKNLEKIMILPVKFEFFS